MLIILFTKVKHVSSYMLTLKNKPNLKFNTVRVPFFCCLLQLCLSFLSKFPATKTGSQEREHNNAYNININTKKIFNYILVVSVCS